MRRMASGNVELAFALQPLPQGFPLDEGHDVVEESVGFTRIEKGQDVGMGELRGDLDLTEEPFGTKGGG